MDIVKSIKTRYATKAFNPDKNLSDAHINAIKDLIRFSPSSTNSQPWHFILARSEESKKQIAKSTQGFYSFNEQKVLDAPLVLVFCAKTNINQSYLLELLETENLAGRFAKTEHKTGQHNGRSHFVNLHRDELNDTNHWMEKQVYLNLGSLLLGVSTMGIDAIPIEGFDAKVLDETFSLKEKGYTSLVIVPLGYRSETDFNASLPKSRWPAERIFTEC